MSLALDVALREIYFNVNGGYMSMEKLYQSTKEDIKEDIKYLHYSQTVPETLQNPKDLCGRTCTTDPDGSFGYE